MTSSTTQVSLANRALLSIGARSTISSLSENSTEAQAVSVFYSPVFTALARTARWGCLRREGSLTLLGAAQGTPENPLGTTLPIPPLPYIYMYAVPSDSLFVRGILPNIPNTGGSTPITPASLLSPTNLSSGGLIPYKMAFTTDSTGNPIEVILTNASQAVGVWTTDDENPVCWDSLFESAFVASLAAYLVPALSLNLPLMNACIKMADAAITIARTADGNESTASQDRQASWVSARMAGTCINNNQYNGQWSGDEMCWPGVYGANNGGLNIA